MFRFRVTNYSVFNNIKNTCNRSIHTMEKPKVLLTRNDITENCLEKLKSKFDLTFWNDTSPAPREFMLENIRGKNGIYCFLTDKIDAELLNAAGPSLKIVSTISVGYDHIDVTECKNRGIKIGHTPDVLTEATAELTVALLLCTSRRLIEASKEAATGGWRTWSPFWMTGATLKGSTVGIVGFGRIGQSVALKLKGFNVGNILYYNRTEKPKEASEINAKKCSFDELLSNSDFVICSMALNTETTNLFNEAAFSKMKSSAVFINTSRGGLVDQESLIKALKNGTIGAAGLDVTTPEPLPLDNPLFQLPNCVVLPHIGSGTIEARVAMANLAAENLIAGLDGKTMPAEL